MLFFIKNAQQSTSPSSPRDSHAKMGNKKSQKASDAIRKKTAMTIQMRIRRIAEEVQTITSSMFV